MDKTPFPAFLSKYYERLQGADSDKESIVELSTDLLERVFSFLGKLVILECARVSFRENFFYYPLFQFLETKASPRDWHCFIRNISNEFVARKIEFVLSPLLELRGKYPSFQQKDVDDRLERLLWFYDVVSSPNKYVISSADISENQEQLLLLVEDLNFLKKVRYEIHDDKSFLAWGNDSICLYPLFYINSENNLEQWGLIDDLETIEKVCQILFPDDFSRYQKQKEGFLEFQSPEESSGYVLLPWTQTMIEEIMGDFLLSVTDMGSKNILLVEGYPGVGKTALANNLDAFLTKEKIADFVFYYLISPGTISEKADTVERWLLKQMEISFQVAGKEALSKYLEDSPCKIIVAIDRLEDMSCAEYEKLSLLTSAPPFRNVGFVFFKRLYDLPEIDACYRMVLKYEDNIYFENSFDHDYVKKLENRYINSPVAWNIFELFSKFPDRFFSVQDISEQINIFTPRVLKHILKMKSLLEISSEIVPKYRLFHPVLCKKLVSSGKA